MHIIQAVEVFKLCWVVKENCVHIDVHWLLNEWYMPESGFWTLPACMDCIVQYYDFGGLGIKVVDFQLVLDGNIVGVHTFACAE